MKGIYLILCCSLLLACELKKEQVDLIVFNANIYTVDEAFTKASAFAVKEGRFIAVGSDSLIRENYEAHNTINAEGKTIVPGLIDAHCHFYNLGLGEQQVDLTGTLSFEEVVERVSQYHKEYQSSMILGRGWDQNDWELKEFPTRQQLDSLYPDTPVILTRIDGHAMLVNQKALDMAGIDGTTVAEGGEIVKKEGVPTGVLIDGPMSLVDAIIADPDPGTSIRALKDAERICFDNGLTTVNDAGLSRGVISLIDSLQKVGDLRIRVYAMIANNSEDLDYYLPAGTLETDRLNVRSVKVYADGALGSRGAVLKQPYSDQAGHFGAMVTPPSEIEKLAERIAASEFQMNTHAIGDSANAVVLRAYNKVLSGKENRRWKIEHAQVIDPVDFEYFETGIIPSVQPTHATSDMYWAHDRLGEERIKGAYAFKSLLEHAGILALGTDFPVEKVNPFHTFYAAVARKDLEDFPPGGFEPQQALSREEALRGMTIWAAYSNFEEEEKGSIENGKWADFLFLSKDLMAIPENEIPGVLAEQVYVSGSKVK